MEILLSETPSQMKCRNGESKHCSCTSQADGRSSTFQLMFGDTFPVNEVSLRESRLHGVDNGMMPAVLFSFAVRAGFEVRGL